MNKTQLILFVTTLTFFLVAMGNLGFQEDVLKSGVPEQPTKSPLEKEICVLDGWDAPIEAIRCAVANINYLMSLVFIETTNMLINHIIFIPISITFVYVVIVVIRGGS